MANLLGSAILRALRSAIVQGMTVMLFAGGAAGAELETREEDAPAQLGTPETDRLDDIFWALTAGFDFSHGDYGFERSSTLYYVPLGLIADYERFRFRVVLPFLVSDGPVAVRNQGGPDTIEDETEVGIGEVALAASYLYEPASTALPFFELGVQMTLPTRSNDRLGTGNLAFATRLDIFKPIGIVTPFGTVGRSFYLVDSLDDRFFASAGVSLRLSQTVSLGLAYDWLEATGGEPGDAHEMVPFLSWKAHPRWSLGPYAVLGLSSGSPDYGVGIGIRFLQ